MTQLTPLYNRVHGEVLKEKMLLSNEKRVTLSFYKYYHLRNPSLFRDQLYANLFEMGVLGRVYVAEEGINAQLSVPASQHDNFLSFLGSVKFLENIYLNYAIEDDGKSFFKLKIKVRKKIVADGLEDSGFDVTNGGKHLSAPEFNRLAGEKDTVIIDMRNHYESEVGHFRNAILPDADTFREALHLAVDLLEPHKEKNIIMYCTGGIRCEKASAYFKYKGYQNVFQLDGGIIKYAADVKSLNLENHFIGKNFVFDERLGERISDDIIARCHQCGKPCDHHTNCKNPACNLLFIQCDECREKMEGCCSASCREIIHQPAELQRFSRKGKDAGIRIFTKGRFIGVS